MPVIKIMTIIVLIALMAMMMEKMLEASSSSFVMEEESTRVARMIFNNKNKGNNKSSTKFFMKENNKDEGVSCFDGLYDVARKEENVLGKKNIENSEIKVKVKGGSLVWWRKFQDKKGGFSLSNMWVCAHNTFHFTSCIPWKVVEIALFWRGGDGNYEWRGDARTQLPKIFKTTQKALSLPFLRERGLF